MSDPPTRRFYLVRHGETVGGSSVRFFGATDVALADEGERQVRALIPRVAALRLRSIVHSPLKRARRSAEILRDAVARPGELHVETAFREVDFGAIEGLTAEEVEAADPEWFVRWGRGEVEGFPDGERIDAFYDRVAVGFRRVCDRFPDGDLMIVCHKGVIKAILVAAAACSFGDARQLEIDLGSMIVMRSADGGGDWVIG